MLHIIGLGLGTEKDVTVAGLEAIQAADVVFLEAYTSVLGVGKARLEAFYGREVIVADREMCESEADTLIIEPALTRKVAFLVVGDPFGATTHTDLVARAKARGVSVRVIHNASIMNAAGCCGLQLYQFGQTVSIVLFTESWRPDSFYDKIKQNALGGLHTLCLLDIKMKEISDANLARGKRIFEPPRFMHVHEAIAQFDEVEARRGEGVLGPNTRLVGLARVGQDDQLIVSGTLGELRGLDLGAPLHSLIVVGHTHPLEDELLAALSADRSSLPRVPDAASAAPAADEED